MKRSNFFAAMLHLVCLFFACIGFNKWIVEHKDISVFLRLPIWVIVLITLGVEILLFWYILDYKKTKK